jgi:hypothetical protein
MAQQDPLKTAQKLPNGARFYRCSLQVNPFEYVKRHKRPTSFSSESDYNDAIIKACIKDGVEVIAVTDHYRVRSSQSLTDAAIGKGLRVFRGFEAVAKDGVHILCLFDPSKDTNGLERLVGACGIRDEQAASPTGQYDTIELLEKAQGEWEGVCVAAHVAGDGGLLTKLSGQTRVNAWTSPYLLACSLPGPAKDAPDNLRPMLENKDAAHRRSRCVAVINAQDVSAPEDLAEPGASCWIKMSDVSVEGLRQAFLDPVSRIRLATDAAPEEHSELLAVAWQGGFLDGAAIHFNENLNVLIGGRGTGKSTVIESIRYALGIDPLGEDASKAHEGIVRHVLRSGTKVSLLLCSHRPDKRRYVVERTVPNPPVVRDDTGNVLNLAPTDIIAEVEVYGQHEISELTKSREKLTRLLDRFMEEDTGLVSRKSDIKRALEKSRTRIADLQKEFQQIDERLGSLPGLEETLRRFQEAGLEEKLKEQSLLLREDRVLRTVAERLVPLRELIDQFTRSLPIDRAFLAAKAIEDLPGKDILSEANPILERLSSRMSSIVKEMKQAIEESEKALGAVRSRWEERKKLVQREYEHILRELQKSKVDGEEFMRLRRQIEELRPMRERRVVLQRDLKEHADKRRNLLAEWEDIKAEEFRQLERAAKTVNRKLKGRVFVEVTAAGNREPLFSLLRSHVGGRLSEALDILKQQADFSLTSFADACRAGRDVLAEEFSIPPAQADRLATADSDTIMQLEELELPPTTAIKLNVAPEGLPEQWQTLEDLSTGQKATAVLLLLLLESQAPLIVDQPEDDLDNRFITDGVVPKMRDEKRSRQFVFATHNANIPVLGDAELIVGLSASGEAGQGKAKLPREHMGSIDARPVRELVEEILEGGKEAFETRRLKYGF